MHIEYLARALSGLVTTPDMVHPHPWYANLTGHHVSLLRDPATDNRSLTAAWKAEQFGGCYAVSS